MFHQWLQHFRNRTASRRTQRRTARRPGVSLAVTQLEDRLAPATIAQMIADINTGPGDSVLAGQPGSSYINLHGKEFFLADGPTDNGLDLRQLYVTDGTLEGTQRLTNNLKDISSLTLADGKLFFTAFDATDIFATPFFDYIYESDGTVAGTQMVSGLSGLDSFGSLMGGSNFLLFNAFNMATDVNNDPTANNYNLYRTDGTTTVPIDPGLDLGSFTNTVIPLSTVVTPPPSIAGQTQTIYFTGNLSGIGDPVNPQIFESDGTTTTQLTNFTNPHGFNNISDLRSANGLVFFQYNDPFAGTTDLWMYNQGTQTLTDLSTTVGVLPGGFATATNSYTPVIDDSGAAGMRVFFVGSDPTDGQQLWVTDGTVGGTQKLTTNIAANGFGDFSYQLANGIVYFTAFDNLGNPQLYQSDGLPGAGHTGLTPLPANLTGVNSLMIAGNQLFFSANDNSIVADYQLWTLQGGTAVELSNKYGRNSQISGVPSSDWVDANGSLIIINVFGNSGNPLYFQDFDSDMWISDGTVAGTQLLHPGFLGGFGPGEGQNLANDAGRVLFIAYSNGFGVEPWALNSTLAPPAINGPTNSTFTAGQAGSFTFTTGGFPTAALTETGALPTGVAVADNGDGTATLSGTPAQGTGGSYVIQVSAANGVPSDAAITFTLTVNKGVFPPSVNLQDAGGMYNGQPYKATDTVTGFGADGILASDAVTPAVDAGTLSYTYYAVTGGIPNPSSASSNAPSAAGTWAVIGHYTSDNASYSSVDSSDLAHALQFTIAPATPTVTVTDLGGPAGTPAAVTGASVFGVGSDGQIAAFGDPRLSYAYFDVNGNNLAAAPSTAGSYTVGAHYTSNNSNYTNAASPAVPFVVLGLLSVSPPNVVSDPVGTAVTLPITATDPNGNFPLTWGATGLPPGLSINTATGVISGTPTVASSTPYSITVDVQDSIGATGTTVFSFSVTHVYTASPVQGNGQSALVNTEYVLPLEIHVADETGAPAVGVGVEFFAPFFGPSVSFSAGGGQQGFQGPQGGGGGGFVFVPTDNNGDAQTPNPNAPGSTNPDAGPIANGLAGPVAVEAFGPGSASVEFDLNNVRTASTQTQLAAPGITFGQNGTVTATVSSNVSAPPDDLQLTVDGNAATESNSTTNPQTNSRIDTFTISGLAAGDHSLGATFHDSLGVYGDSSATGTLHVDQATPLIQWGNPAEILYGTPLDSTQLNATASYIAFSTQSPNGSVTPVSGILTYIPAAGTILNLGNQMLDVSFAPMDTNDFTTATASVPITVESPADTYAPLGATVPITDPAGTYSGPGATMATTDPAGTFSGPGAAMATTDPAGTFSAPGAAMATTDPAGTFSGPGAATATIDPAGTFSAPGAATATTDPAGTFSGPGAATASTDPAGTFSGPGAATATTDPAGTFSGPGAATATTDSAGTFSGPGAAMATIDPAGTYSGPDAAAPTPAPAGTYIPSTGATSVADAITDSPGYFSGPGAAAPTPAPIGYYVSTAGASAPTLDPAGTFTNKLASTAPIPIIIWANPADITYGTLLGSTQLDATAGVAGAFNYAPAAGTLLKAGLHQPLQATFVPQNPIIASATASVAINVIPAVLTVSATGTQTFGASRAILTPTYAGFVNGQTLATSGVMGSPGLADAVTSSTPVGDYPITVTVGTLTASNYSFKFVSGILTVTAPTETIPHITWTPPSPITYGTRLSSAQLNATASVPGTFVYTPALGNVLRAGVYTLSTTFTPFDTVDYTTATATVTLVVNPVRSIITWATPDAITYGTALSSSQLDATANVTGKFVYSPAAGTLLSAGTQTLSVTFTPTDAVDYTTATASVALIVHPAKPSYWLATNTGVVIPLDDTQFHGSITGHLDSPIVGIASAGPGNGYWLLAANGGVFPFGATYYGSVTGSSSSFVGMAGTPDRKGYWLVNAAGQVFAFGDARLYPGSVHVFSNIVAITSTSDGKGYWLVDTQGNVYSYGDAVLYGSAPVSGNSHVVAMAVTADGKGYWLATNNGLVYAFGDARFEGDPADVHFKGTIVGMAAGPNDASYWLVTTTGAIFAFRVPALGNAAPGQGQTIVGIAFDV